MIEHTPGPWQLTAGRTIETGSGEFYLTYESNDNGGRKWRGTFVELDNNSRLVSAAPELLAALKVAIQVMQDNYIDESMAGEFELFTDAVNKAEGIYEDTQD
jgi:hypothetical protein